MLVRFRGKVGRVYKQSTSREVMKASKSHHHHHSFSSSTFLNANLPFFYSASRLLHSHPYIFTHFFTFPTKSTNQPTTAKMQFTTILLFIASASALAIESRQANSQTFTGALGGFKATPITDSGDAKRPFAVKGDTFVNLGAALQRSCDQQFNACANSANGGNKAITTAQCSAQQSKFISRCE
jgi:hypothetical protein